MRRAPLSIALIFIFLVAPLANFIPDIGVSHAQTRPNKLRPDKLADSLRERVRQAHPDSAETARVILNLNDSADPQQLDQALKQNGARSSKNLDALGLMVADVPLNKLEETAGRNDVSWISADQDVRSLSTDNTSHVEVTTGASKVLPLDKNNVTGSGVAGGGAGNGIGVAVLDSGVTPADAAEFVGYQWQQSGGLLSTGLLSQSYIQ